MPSPMTLPEFIDRKRQIEVDIAAAIERLALSFHVQTGTTVEKVDVHHVTDGLYAVTVEVRL